MGRACPRHKACRAGAPRARPSVLVLNCCSGEAQHPATLDFLVVEREADELLPKELFFRVVTCWFGRCGCGRPHPATATAAPNTHCISKKATGLGGRQKSPAPRQGDWCLGNYWSTPQGAGHSKLFP